MILVALLLVALIPQQRVETPKQRVEALLRASDEVVRAQVAAIHEVPRAKPRERWTRPARLKEPGDDYRRIRIAELEVEEVLWGTPTANSLFVLDDADYLAEPTGRLQVGDQGIAFLTRAWQVNGEDPETAEQLITKAKPAGLYTTVVRATGLHYQTRGWMPIERRWVRVRFPGTRSVLLEDLERWVRGHLERLAPSIEANLITNGPFGNYYRINAQGKGEFSVYGRKGTIDIGRAGIDSILKLAEEQRFLELPDLIGRSPGPDSEYWDLRVRTASGSRKVRVYGPPAANDPVDKRAHARFMAVWAALPEIGGRKLNGR